MYNVQCSLFNDVSHEHKEAHAKMFSALQTVYGSGNDVSNERWARAKIIWAFSNYELESVLKLHWRSNWLFILQFGRTSLPAKNQITISPFFSATCNHYLQGNTSATHPVLDTSLTRISIRPSCYSFYRSYFILHPSCHLHPSVNLHTTTFLSPLCAQQFRPWWDRLTFGLTPSLSDSLILPSLRSIPKTFQPTQPQHQNHI